MLGWILTKVDGDAEAYVAEKLLAAGTSDDEIAAIGASASTLGEPPKLVDPATISLTQAQEIEVRTRRRCALQGLREDAPLIEDEVILDDQFSVLAAAWDELPAGTAVLRRETNRAVIYYVFPDWRLDPDQGLVWTEPPTALLDPKLLEAPTTEAMPKLAGLAAMSVMDLVLPIAKALGGAIAGKAGTFVLEAVFPPTPPSYFDEVYKQVARVVGVELRQHDIDLISTRLNALLDWQRRVYNPKNPRSITDTREREKLFDQVEAEIRKLDDAVAILRHPKWNKPGFTVFSLAGSVYLALCQEAALMDYHNTDPSKSSYYKTIQLTAADFANSLESTLAEILRLRREGVHLSHGNQNIRLAGKNYMFRTYHFVDPGNNKKGPVRTRTKKDNKTIVGDPLGAATKDMDEYRARLPALMEQELGDPTLVIAQWRGLVKQPLPK